MGLAVDEVAAQIGRSDSKVSAGLMRNSSAGDVLIEVEGEMDSLDRIRRTPIQFSEDGQFVQLGDIATISKDIRRPSTDLALVAGRPAVTVAAFVESDYRVDRWAADARREVAELANELPNGIGLEVVFDQTEKTWSPIRQDVHIPPLPPMLFSKRTKVWVRGRASRITPPQQKSRDR